MTVSTKTCTGCGQTKELDQFPNCYRALRIWKRSRCKACQTEDARRYRLMNPGRAKERSRRHYLANKKKVNENSRRWHLENPEKHRESCRRYRLKDIERDRKRRRRNYLQRHYNTTPEHIDELIAQQKGKCPVCLRKFGKGRAHGPATDHCHKAGHIRGILCGICNRAEGMLKTPETARRLLAYMEKNELFYQHNGESKND